MAITKTLRRGLYWLDLQGRAHIVAWVTPGQDLEPLITAEITEHGPQIQTFVIREEIEVSVAA